MKQTSVEWLHEEYMRILKDNDISVLQAFEILDKYNQAKEMYKEQMIEFANSFYDECGMQYGGLEKSAEEYYNETFNTNEK
jgi:hypothetical protein